MSVPGRSNRGVATSEVDRQLGVHPPVTVAIGRYLSNVDEVTPAKVPHRVLSEYPGARVAAVPDLKEALTRHHASAEQLERSRRIQEALTRQGLKVPASIRRYPTADTTRKGNFAEVVLAEYVAASSSATLPVYRLRFNTNIEQSMKGDDVLAFDLDSEPVRIVVGEAKFRETPSQAAIADIFAGLGRSYWGGLPMSLQFVADRLFGEQQPELGQRVAECAERLAEGRLRLDYVGLLFSNERAADVVRAYAPAEFHRLVVVSAGVPDPSGLVRECYDGLE